MVGRSKLLIYCCSWFSKRYRVTAVERVVKYGNSLCIIEIAAGMGLLMLNRPPAVTVPAKNKTVITINVHFRFESKVIIFLVLVRHTYP